MNTAIKNAFRKLFMVLVLGSFLTAGVQAPVMAAMVSTAELSSTAQIETMRDEIRTLLARDDVRSHLQKYGVNDADLNDRIGSMTNQEVLAFHAQMDEMPTGEGALGVIIAVLVIFILLDVAGVTDIFPRI